MFSNMRLEKTSKNAQFEQGCGKRKVFIPVEGNI